ncbi:hypothetical protein [Nocardioides sp.]|uniref:hypothetical protein n=1 Tax=Nocardioides sp. TaxID=35761 RepID=UPI0035280DD3
MRMRRALLAGVAAWLAVVLVGATVVWAVISRAGQELSSGDGFARAGSAATSAGPRTTSPSGPLVKRSHKPSGKPSTKATSPSTPPTSSAPTDEATPTSPPASSSPPKPPSTPKPPPGSTKHTATWIESPGRLTATCNGAKLTINSLIPNDGWESEKPEKKSDSVFEVHFHSEKSDKEVELTIACVAGRPDFHTHGDGD